MMTNPKPLLQRQAVRAAVKLFLAGVGGLLKPVKPMTFELYPELIRGLGANTPENEAFTHFMLLLISDITLEEEHCHTLLELLEISGLKHRYWGNLPKTSRTRIAPLLKNSACDWSGLYFRRLPLDIVWAKLDVAEPVILDEQFSLNALLPPSLLVELNGFNGHLFHGKVPSGYDDNCDRLGTKWAEVNVAVLEDVLGSEDVRLEFDTAWSPAIPPIEVLASRYPNMTITHYFCEAGMCFCGYRRYEKGDLYEEQWDTLEYSEHENEEGYYDVTGPDYIANTFECYGG
jgi:hypothetical protein